MFKPLKILDCIFTGKLKFQVFFCHFSFFFFFNEVTMRIMQSVSNLWVNKAHLLNTFTYIQLSFSNIKQKLLNVLLESPCVEFLPAAACPSALLGWYRVALQGSCVGAGSSLARYLGSPSCHCVFENLCGWTDELFLCNLNSQGKDCLFPMVLCFPSQHNLVLAMHRSNTLRK